MQNTGIMTLQETIKARVSVRNEKYIDEALVKRWLERITVWEDHFTVELKSGLNSDKGKYKGTESFDVYSQTKLSLIVRVTAWLLAIPDTLFFQPTFPFSDYCLKRRKAQSAKDRPAKS